MSTADAARRTAAHRESDSAYQRLLDVLEETMPTLEYRRPPPTSGVERALDRDRRGPLPAYRPAARPSDLRLVEHRRVVRRTARTRRRIQEVELVPALWTDPVVDAASNPFLTPPRPTDPPALWEQPSTMERPTRRRSILPVVAVATALAIGVGLWRDASSRAKLDSIDAVLAFVLELASR